ncbi:unnamed protein product, partial [Gongylonema pulchrum]|uniref:ARS2 domain-containing protein n=1 Tax=Gongylonema pulchrum TaxID=637853 RepID=A0A183DZZ7_9BILA
FEENVYKSEGGDSEGEESDDSSKGRKRTDRKGDRKKRREDDEYRPDELAFNKSEYFKIEKVLGQFGWGRWKVMRGMCDVKECVTEADIEHISRTLLLHCIREYRGDEKIREFVWRLIIPKGAQVAGKNTPKKKSTVLTSVFHEGWAALPEYNPPAFAVDSSFQRHVHRHSNKLLIRMHQLHILNTEVIGSKSEEIMNGAKAEEIDLTVDWNDAFNIDAIRADPALCFGSKEIEVFPNIADLLNRFRRLLTHFQRKRHDSLTFATWSKREEAEFMRVLRSYGVKDDPSTIISWTRFRQLSPLLEKKTDSELMEQLYCILSMCTKQLGNEMTAVDLQRALKLCSNEAMPSGWSVEQDEELFKVVDENGLDNISANIVNKPAFQKIIRPEEKTLLRRVAEIYTTLQTKKWNGAASTELLEDSVTHERPPLQQEDPFECKIVIAWMGDPPQREIGKLTATSITDRNADLEQFPFAAAAVAQSGGFLLPSLLSSGAGSSSAAAQAQAAMLSALFSLPPAAPVPTSSASSSALKQEYGEDVLNLSTKKSQSSSTGTSSADRPSTSMVSEQAANILNNLNITELFALANLPPETHVPVVNVETRARLVGEQAPKLKNLGPWLTAHPKFILDIPPTTPTVMPTSAQSAHPKSVEKSETKTISKALEKASGSKDSKDPPIKQETSAIQTTPSSSKTAATPMLEPGEIPRSLAAANSCGSSGVLSSAAAAAAAASLASMSFSEQPVAVFHRSTGALVPADKWPVLKNLSSWLDKHPDYNVHSTSASLALVCPLIFFQTCVFEKDEERLANKSKE